MPIRINQDRDQDLTVIAVVGDILQGEPLQALKAFYAGEPTTLVIWDFRQMSSGQITAAEIKEIFEHAMLNMMKRQCGRTALVAPEDYKFGLARMTTTFGELADAPWELRAFRTLDEAVNWLGVSYPLEEPHPPSP